MEVTQGYFINSEIQPSSEFGLSTCHYGAVLTNRGKTPSPQKRPANNPSEANLPLKKRQKREQKRESSNFSENSAYSHYYGSVSQVSPQTQMFHQSKEQPVADQTFMNLLARTASEICQTNANSPELAPSEVHEAKKKIDQLLTHWHDMPLSASKDSLIILARFAQLHASNDEPVEESDAKCKGNTSANYAQVLKELIETFQSHASISSKKNKIASPLAVTHLHMSLKLLREITNNEDFCKKLRVTALKSIIQSFYKRRTGANDQPRDLRAALNDITWNPFLTGNQKKWTIDHAKVIAASFSPYETPIDDDNDMISDTDNL